ncbi:MAG: hypothetical protein KAS32_23845 [Candidatus Peribacteraceae bacterium]|nr:hypothetical protein [Candidatus Peribacteraceae bacterium]
MNNGLGCCRECGSIESWHYVWCSKAIAPLTYQGIEVVTNPLIPEEAPKITLSNKVMVTTEFREKFNAWLLGFFGTERGVYMVCGKLVMHPTTATIINNRIKNEDNFLRY